MKIKLLQYNPWDAGSQPKIKIAKPISEKQGGGGGGFNLNNFFNNLFNGEKSAIFAVLIGICVLWLSSGIFVINQNEQGVITRFGKYVRIATPGLGFKMFYPVEKLTKVQTTTIQKMQIAQNNANLILTGDENIVDVNFEVQWRINDPQKFLFNLSEPVKTIFSVAESAMREVVGRNKIQQTLSTGRYNIEQDVKKTIQKILDEYNGGIEIVLVQMLRVDPPHQVIDAFRDVQTAKADKEDKINQAIAYQNSIVPKAKGEAEKIIEQANAYKSVVLAEAEGKAQRFSEIYKQYQYSKNITKKRLYIETMEQVVKNNDVIIMEKSSTSSALPYFTLDKK